MVKVSLLLSDAQTLEQNQDKLLALPAQGAPVNGGIHGPIAASWNGVGAVPKGWRSYRGSSFQHPTLPQFATPIDPEANAAMANGRRARLTASEQTKMTADLAAAVATLPVDWFPAGAQAAKANESGRT